MKAFISRSDHPTDLPDNFVSTQNLTLMMTFFKESKDFLSFLGPLIPG